jgi:hypothetical protein
VKLWSDCSTVSDPRSLADAYVKSLGPAARRVADGEWGVTLEDVAGWPLHVGIRLRDGFLRAQAEVVGADRIGDHELLFRNRTLRVVRLAHTGAGDVWVVGDLPEASVSAAELDRLLGLLVAAATEVRLRAQAA